jgi:hypothetical protein
VHSGGELTLMATALHEVQQLQNFGIQENFFGQV